MSTMPPEQHPSQPGQGADTHVRYIDDLAGSDDAWITITDAARITRTSEAMARRWVTSGRLPVKRQAVGMNQQTRLVRLSDVAAIRPIIDPTAAVSDGVHKLDLPSIPRQQAHILQEHERLTQQVRQGQHAVDEVRRDLREAALQQQQAIEELHQQFSTQQDEWQRRLTLQQQQHDTLRSQLHDQAQALEQINNDMTEQGRQLQQEGALLRTMVMDQVQTAQHEAEQRLSELDVAQHQQREHLREHFSALVKQHYERTQNVLNVMGDTLTRLDQERDQLQHTISAQQQAFAQLQGDLTTFIEQQGSEIKQAFEQHMSQQIQERADLSDRLEKMEQWQEQLTAQEYQQRLTAQDEQIQFLRRMLQEERAGCKTFSEELTAQQDQVDVLRRGLDGL